MPPHHHPFPHCGQRSQKVEELSFTKTAHFPLPPVSSSVRHPLATVLPGVLSTPPPQSPHHHHMQTPPPPTMTQFGGDDGVSEDHCEYHGREARCSSSLAPLAFRRSSHLVKHTHCESARVFVSSFLLSAVDDSRSGWFDVSPG